MCTFKSLFNKESYNWPLFVFESDILGPIDDFSNIEKLVSFERAMFKITVSNTE